VGFKPSRQYNNLPPDSIRAAFNIKSDSPADKNQVNFDESMGMMRGHLLEMEAQSLLKKEALASFAGLAKRMVNMQDNPDLFNPYRVRAQPSGAPRPR